MQTLSGREEESPLWVWRAFQAAKDDTVGRKYYTYCTGRLSLMSLL